MKPPRFFVAAVVLFWGWQTQLWVFAIPMAAWLEARYWTDLRWQIEDHEFHRVVDAVSVLLLLTCVYLFQRESIHGLFTLLSWTPILFFPLVLLQTYSTVGTISFGSLFLSLRHQPQHHMPHFGSVENPAERRVNLVYPYIFLCLIAASQGQHPWYFVVATLLLAWWLWSYRPHTYSIAFWLSYVLLIGVIAYALQSGIRTTHSMAEQIITQWIQEWMWQTRDPYRQKTRIGEIGYLKESNQIMMYVDSDHPIYLREAVYNNYFKGIWQAPRSKFEPLNPDESVSHWSLSSDYQRRQTLPNFPEQDSVQIATYLPRGQGVLALPNGTYQINGLFGNMQHNLFGVVKINESPHFAEYQARYVFNQSIIDARPLGADDLELPYNEQPIFEQLVKLLGLRELEPSAAVKAIEDYFANSGFTYSLLLSAPIEAKLTPLTNFLEYKKSGHCEYYATATVLLLRAAGIPARYASGYVAQEFSELEQRYIVRKRHAHAWALAYVNGHWQAVDTTPAVWIEMEAAARSHWLQPIGDLWSWVYLHYSRWRWLPQDNANHQFWWLLLPLSILFLWRLYQRKCRSPQIPVSTKPSLPVVGQNSAFFQVIEILQKQGYQRSAGENLSTWLQRIALPESEKQQLQSMLAIHLRHRFDPIGITVQQESWLQDAVEEWCNNVSQNSKQHH